MHNAVRTDLELTVGVDISATLSSDVNQKYKFTQPEEKFPGKMLFYFFVKIYIVQHEQNRRNKLVLEIELSKGVPVSFSPTRLIIFFLHADWLER